jgi:D-alanine-D-alanine ligase
MKYHRVGVLFGGQSNERAVSLESGRAVAAGLRKAGYDVIEIDVGGELDRQLRDAAIDAAYIALHGKRGEDGTVQGLLEMMRIPYTGSSVTASALAMDKQLTRVLLTAAGLEVAPGIVLKNDDSRALPEAFTLPVVIKPIAEGSSVGVSIAKSENAFQSGLAAAFEIADRALLEAFVKGKEIQVAVLDGTPLGAVEIEPNREFYDYEAKYTQGGAQHHIPPRISKSLLKTCNSIGCAAYNAIGCAGLARIDLIVPTDGPPIVLEVNTSPGMTALSLAPEIAAHAGLAFDELVKRVMEGAALHVR